MPDLLFSAKLMDRFIDRPAIDRAIRRSKKQPLVKGGAFIRRAARSSIKKVARPKKGFSKNKAVRARQQSRLRDPSPAGTPPKSRSTEPNLRTIFFVWDPAVESVVVGPVVLANRSTDRPAGDIHEHGGRAVIKIRNGRRGKVKRIRANYKPRPFMGPALQETIPKVPQLTKNFIGP